MKMEILPGKGYISDNENPKFGTSGHEELLLFPHGEGTVIALDAKVGLSRTGGAMTMRVAEYVAKPVSGLITRLLVPAPKAGRVAACRNHRASANARSTVSAAVSARMAVPGITATGSASVLP